MFASKFLVVVAIPIWLLLSSLSCFNYEAYGDDASSSSSSSSSGDVKCDPQCQQLSPPISGGYPSYGAPPPPQPQPPPPPPPPSGYSIYGAPPPPHKEGGQSSKCPPAGGVECCTPPAPYYYSTYGPPTPNVYTPPMPYTYMPNGQGFTTPALVPIQVMSFFMMLILSCLVLLF